MTGCLVLSLGSALGACWKDGGTPVLWAWDRPEDLTFLAPREAAVAYLAATVDLGDGGRAVVPRRGPLRLPHGVERIVVVRIEAPPGTATDPRAAGEVARAIEALVPAGASSLQIDLDATPPQRAFYRALLEALAKPRRTLSITALASWCLGDPWIADLPVDFAVPMLYRMGPDGPAIRESLDRGRDFPVRLCRRHAGFSDDEPWPRVPTGTRLWFFSRQAWTADRYAEFRAGIDRAALSSPP